LLDVQRTALPRSVDTVPVEQAKGGVARLLDLGDHQAGAQGMDGPRGNEDAVSHDWLERVEALVAGPASNGLGQLLAVDSWLQPGVNLTIWLGGEYDPRLGLSQVGGIKQGTLCIVGMDLHAQGFFSVEEL